ETRTSPVVVGRKISPAVERLAFWRKERGEWPSPLPGNRTDRQLIAAVDVGTLIAVHLHRDKVLIDDASHFRIIVGLAIHDMTPMAPDGPDIQQHGLVLALGGSESLLTPLMPLNGLVHGGAKVSRRGLRQ